MHVFMKSTLAALALVNGLSVYAAVSAEEARQLGHTLTPWGAEKAGNKDGSIPAYNGGLTKPPAAYDPSKPHLLPDPFASEKPLFSVTAANLASHRDKLTDGLKAMFAKYPNFRIDVYPSHRTARYPKAVEEATIANAVSCKDTGDVLEGCGPGLPFPIPKTGNEIAWNHMLGYQGPSWKTRIGSYVVDASGNMTLNGFNDVSADVSYYSKPEVKDAKVRTVWHVRYDTDEPARSSGERVLQKCAVDLSDNCYFWQYLPGQRRVKLSPDLAYDTPNPQSAGSSGMDDVQGFFGRTDRFNIKLIGKREMYVPANGYKLLDASCADEKLLTKNFPNPACLRWELRRVWVAEATLKEGKRHVYSKRVMYLDEDTYMSGVFDNYDGSGKIYRVAIQIGIPLYNDEQMGTWGQPFATFDLQTGIYGFFNYPSTAHAGRAPVRAKISSRELQPEALAGGGVR